MDNDMDDRDNDYDTLRVAAEIDVLPCEDDVQFVIMAYDPDDEYQGKWRMVRMGYN